MGKSNNRIIVNSLSFHDMLCTFGFFNEWEKVLVSDGYIYFNNRANRHFPVEAKQDFSIDIEGKKLKRLRKILKHVPEQPVCIRFDSHIEIEGITI